MVSSMSARLSVVSLLIRVQYDSRASLVVAFQPLREGCDFVLPFFAGRSSVFMVQVRVQITYQWSDMARLSSFGFWMCAWPGVHKGMNM